MCARGTSGPGALLCSTAQFVFHLIKYNSRPAEPSKPTNPQVAFVLSCSDGDQSRNDKKNSPTRVSSCLTVVCLSSLSTCFFFSLVLCVLGHNEGLAGEKGGTGGELVN